MGGRLFISSMFRNGTYTELQFMHAFTHSIHSTESLVQLLQSHINDVLPEISLSSPTTACVL